MNAPQNRQKLYANMRRISWKFQAGEHAILRITPTAGNERTIKLKKQTQKFIGHYQITRRIGPEAYEIALPSHLANFYMGFTVKEVHCKSYTCVRGGRRLGT